MTLLEGNAGQALAPRPSASRDRAIAKKFTQLHRQMPAITHVTMPDTGHFPHLQRPVEFDARVMDFLAAAD